ncbi:hypothetical protein [Hufsiella arboris]|nr:hypothetical protein [Hufsiella arboris]
MYITDFAECTVLKVQPDGTASLLAGKKKVSALVDGKGGDARFSGPTAIRLAAEGYLVVTDGSGKAWWDVDKTLRKIYLGGTVRTFYKAKENEYIDDVAIAKRDKDFKASRYENYILAIESFADDYSSNYQIRHLSDTGEETPITALNANGFKNGYGYEAQFNTNFGYGSPLSLTVWQNTIYVADNGNDAIRTIRAAR